MTKYCAPSGLLTIPALTPFSNVLTRYTRTTWQHSIFGTSSAYNRVVTKTYRCKVGTKATARATNYRDAEGKTQENTKTSREIAGDKLDRIVRDLFRSLEPDSSTL